MINRKTPNKPSSLWVIIGGIAGTLCVGCFGISTLQGLFAGTPPDPTLDMNAVNTQAHATAVEASIQTLSVPGATAVVEYTLTLGAVAFSTFSPVATDTQHAVIPITGASCIPNNPQQTGRVVDVVDGDTIKVLLDEDGLTYTVRYIGMDTPENTSQIEYFGPESTARNIELVAGRMVTLVKDVSETDPFGRLLRYVLAEDVFVNYELVAQGYANTASYPPDVACISTFQEVERQASSLKLGLWSAPPTLAVIVPTTIPSGGGGGGNAVCNCSGPDLDCGDFTTHSAAQACYNYCVSQGYGDVFRLDGNDNDGLACESLP